jgi:hypothetical protein
MKFFDFKTVSSNLHKGAIFDELTILSEDGVESSGLLYNMHTQKGKIYQITINAELLLGDKAFLMCETTSGKKLIERDQFITPNNSEIVATFEGINKPTNIGLLFWNAEMDYKLKIKKFEIEIINRKSPKPLLYEQKIITTNNVYKIEEIGKLMKLNKYIGIFVQWHTIPWNTHLYQRPQHICTNMAKLNYLVIYMTAYAEDNIDSDILKQNGDVYLCSSNKILEYLNDANISFYSTIPSNELGTIYQAKANNRTIYEYIDHIDPKISWSNCDALSKIKDKSLDLKNNLFDMIVTSADVLYDEYKNIYPENRLIMAKNGVDIGHYNRDLTDFKLPSKVLNFSKKYSVVIGYFGAIAPWLDYTLINDLVKLHHDIGFLFIGPDYLNCVGKLPIQENFLHIGSIDYKILPYYANLFTLCMIPFEKGEIAKSTSPLKLYEYFALKKPVIVTSDMKECVKFEEVFHSDNVLGLSDAIKSALILRDDEKFKDRLFQLAVENSWFERAKALNDGLIKCKVNKTLILIDNKNMLFDTNASTYTLSSQVWGVNVCSVAFLEDKYFYKHNLIGNHYGMFISCFSSNEGQLIIKINKIEHIFDIKNSIQEFFIDTEITRGAEILIYTDKYNTVYFKSFILV